MAITTLSGASQGMRPPVFFSKTSIGGSGQMETLWAKSGFPAAGAYNATLNGVTLSSSSAQVTGQIPFFDPASGNSYLGEFSYTYAPNSGNSYQSPALMLADRLWHNGGYTITSVSAQNSTTPTWPSRDANGGTSGVGVVLAVEVSSQVTGASGQSITVSYTNSSGTSGRTATNAFAIGSGIYGGASFIPLTLQAGDVGVQSVQSLTLAVSWVAGTINLVAYRPIAQGRPPNIGQRTSMDALTSGFPQLYNGTVPFLVNMIKTGSVGQMTGTVNFTQG